MAKVAKTKIITGWGRVKVEFPDLRMGPNDIAFASITEVDDRDTPFYGPIVMTVNNITPLQNKVVVRCYIGWWLSFLPRRARVSILVP
jgi:hypothetical protein